MLNRSLKAREVRQIQRFRSRMSAEGKLTCTTPDGMVFVASTVNDLHVILTAHERGLA